MQKTQKFHIGIKGILINKNKALIVENSKPRVNRYSLPGGQIDIGENISKALKREIEEELGIKKIEVGELIHVFEKKDDFDNSFGFLIVVYKIKAKTSKIKLSNEHLDYKWIDKRELQLLNKNKKNFNQGIVHALNLVI